MKTIIHLIVCLLITVILTNMVGINKTRVAYKYSDDSHRVKVLKGDMVAEIIVYAVMAWEVCE